MHDTPDPVVPRPEPMDARGPGRALPGQAGVVGPDPGRGGGAATPSFGVPPGAPTACRAVPGRSPSAPERSTGEAARS